MDYIANSISSKAKNRRRRHPEDAPFLVGQIFYSLVMGSIMSNTDGDARRRNAKAFRETPAMEAKKAELLDFVKYLLKQKSRSQA
jgi:hypothetical protein